MTHENTEIRTFQDLIDYLEDATGLDATQNGDLRRMRTAIDSAIKRLAAERSWTYYRQLGRVVTSAPQATGTIGYDHSGGAYERQVTLTGATWPEWVLQGTLFVDSLPYEIEDFKSSTVITLAPAANPGADLAGGTAYTLVRETYPLPNNCQGIQELVELRRNTSPVYVPPNEFLDYQRSIGNLFGRPVYYTLQGSPDFLGVKAIRFAPAPSQALSYDYHYIRWPRPVRIQRYYNGLVTGSEGSATLTGSDGAAWTPLMEGSILRIAEGRSVPSGAFGDNPALMERMILSVDSPTNLTLDDALDEAVTLAGYMISDPLDVDVSLLWQALKACAELLLPQHPARNVSRYDGRLEAAYRDALRMAANGDSAARHDRVAGPREPRMAFNVDLNP